MRDGLGLFANRDTGSVDLDELRSALSKNAQRVTTSPTRPANARFVPQQRSPEPPSMPRRIARRRREEQARRSRRRRRHTLVAVIVLALLTGSITAGFLVWRSAANQIADFSGPPGREVLVRVETSDSRLDVAGKLFAAGVVGSPEAFVNATENDADVARVQPGYYKLPTNLPAVEAATQLVLPANRVGRLRIIPGRELADVRTRAGRTVPGYVTAITEAACVPLNGERSCFTAAELWAQIETADPGTLDIPQWAIDGVRAAPDPRKRLEGIILPGDYLLTPNGDPQQVLKDILYASTASWGNTPISAAAREIGVTPWEAAIVASLVEREGATADMPKVATVIYNRMQQRMKLQLDSTVNYALTRAQISTTKADRTNASPYNTYARIGLPPTPVTSPGPAALNATLAPTAGSWLYFVKINKSGASCFSVTGAEHAKCVAKARANGVFDE